MTTYVRVPLDVLARAVEKAKEEYQNVAAHTGADVGDDECWAEFEALAEYLEP